MPNDRTIIIILRLRDCLQLRVYSVACVCVCVCEQIELRRIPVICLNTAQCVDISLISTNLILFSSILL